MYLERLPLTYTQGEIGAGQSVLQCLRKSPQPTPRSRERHKGMQTGTGQLLGGSSRGFNTASMPPDDSVTKDQSRWGFTVKQGATTIHEDSAAYTVSSSSLTMEVKAATRALRWIVSRGDRRTHMPSSSQIQ